MGLSIVFFTTSVLLHTLPTSEDFLGSGRVATTFWGYLFKFYISPHHTTTLTTSLSSFISQDLPPSHSPSSTSMEGASCYASGLTLPLTYKTLSRSSTVGNVIKGTKITYCNYWQLALQKLLDVHIGDNHEHKFMYIFTYKAIPRRRYRCGKRK